MKLARALGNDEVEPDAEEVGFAALVGVLLDEYDRVQGTDAFAKLVEERSEVTIRGVDWQVGLSSVDEETTIKLEVSSENIDDVFDEAGRHIGDEGLHKEWWKVRRRESVDNTQAKLELVALSIDPAVRRRLESAAQQKVQEWLRGHKTAIDGLTERRRQTYDDIRGQAADPELRSLALPEEMTITKSDSLWEMARVPGRGRQIPCDIEQVGDSRREAGARSRRHCRVVPQYPAQALGSDGTLRG